MASCSRFIVLELSHQLAVCRIRFSIASLRCKLLSYCYITDDMKAEVSDCSAKLDGRSLVLGRKTGGQVAGLYADLFRHIM